MARYYTPRRLPAFNAGPVLMGVVVSLVFAIGAAALAFSVGTGVAQAMHRFAGLLP